MSRFDRAIDFAFDTVWGKIFDANEEFSSQKNAFEIRKQFHQEQRLFYCCECGQILNVSTSKLDRLYFKHQPGHSPCLLTDGDLSQQEIKEFRDILVAKESARHRELKRKISAGLSQVSQITDIAVDEKYIIHKEEKRKPDVYCKYGNRELVFEIQLSNLSLRYILSRYEFYKKRDIYLIWILDNFDVHGQSQMTRDIKYLNRYENFFKLDESGNQFRLICDYKDQFLTSELDVRSIWKRGSIRLDELQFDEENFQAFYFDYPKRKSAIEIERSNKVKEKKSLALQQANVRAQQKTDKLIADIKKAKAEGVYYFLAEEVDDLSPLEIEVFNSKLGFTKAGNYHINSYYANTQTEKDKKFLGFLLNCDNIWIDVNGTDKEGKSVLQALYSNPALVGRHSFLINLFKRGYKLKESDISFLEELPDSGNYGAQNGLALCQILDRLQNRKLSDLVYWNGSLACILESARLQKIVGYKFKPDAWHQLANIVLPSHGKHWSYVDSTFKYYSTWEKIFAMDRKGNIQKKYNALILSIPQQIKKFEPAFNDLFPEVRVWMLNEE